MIMLYNGDCREVLRTPQIEKLKKERNAVIVTDPPFNIGYHYNTYKDNLDKQEYLSMLGGVVGDCPAVLIHYPEVMYEIAGEIGRTPERVVAWIYNSNTAKQHRDIGFFGVAPKFDQVRQPYKNPKDKRIQKRMAEGHKGAKIYDWWNVNQVKNVSKEKSAHPCQMPQQVMDNIIGILPKDDKLIVIDPFMGSGTTGIACKKYGIDFVGIEIDKEYFKIAKERINAPIFSQLDIQEIPKWNERSDTE